MKRAIYKAEVIIDDEGKLKVTSFANRKIPYPILFNLNEAVHNVRERFNHEADWKRKYIHFTHEGKKYKQIDRRGSFCNGCVFAKVDIYNCLACAHPYYETKESCEDKIYIEEETNESKN